jgi:hypothetical protein
MAPGRAWRAAAAGALALASAGSLLQPARAAFSTTLHGAPTGTRARVRDTRRRALYARGRSPRRRLSHLGAHFAPLALERCAETIQPGTPGAATMALQPWLTTYDADVRARVAHARGAAGLPGSRALALMVSDGGG